MWHNLHGYQKLVDQSDDYREGFAIAFQEGPAGHLVLQGQEAAEPVSKFAGVRVRAAVVGRHGLEAVGCGGLWPWLFLSSSFAVGMRMDEWLRRCRCIGPKDGRQDAFSVRACCAFVSAPGGGLKTTLHGQCVP